MNMELVTEHYAHYAQVFNMCIMLYFSVDLDRFIHYCASLYVKYLEQLVSDDYWPKVGKLIYTA